jgi:hypothetical protein
MANGGAFMQRWDELVEKFSRITDKTGRPIDEGIFETVVALNALDITTSMSCEGHLDHGLPYPWIDVGISSYARGYDTPEIQQLILRLRELRREQDKDIKMQQLWQEENKLRLQQRHKLFGYLAEFYKKREVPFDRIITFVSSGRIRSQGGDFLELLSPGEQEQKLHEYQDEMRQFAAFLKSILNTKKP